MSWHPIQEAIEPEPGRWELFTRPGARGEPSPVKLGEVRLVRVNGAAVYRARARVLAQPDSTPEDLGAFQTLLAAASAAHTHANSNPEAYWKQRDAARYP